MRGASATLLALAIVAALCAAPGAGAASVANPAQAQYELAPTAPSAQQRSMGGSAGATAAQPERPVNAVRAAFDDREVVLVTLIILALTLAAIAIAWRLGPSRVGVPAGALGAGLVLVAVAVVALPAVGGARPKHHKIPRVPHLFYGMSAQSPEPLSEYRRMKRNGVTTLRVGIAWNAIEPSPGAYDFSSVDPTVADAARAGLDVFPFIGATPNFYGVNCTPADCFTSLPSQTAVQRQAWMNMLRALVGRYGPRGNFWADNPSVPKRPIRYWQIWNEANFIFFSNPRSPSLYGKLVQISHQAIHSVDPGGKVVLAGLFGHPKGALGIQAPAFLNRLYRVRGIKGSFDAVALHPYSRDASELKPDIGAMRRVMARHGDARTPLFLTEFGWGSGHNTRFGKGIKGQVSQLARAYTLLRKLQRPYRIARTYWFAWNDFSGTCNFCDTAGLVRENGRAKPALGRFSQLAHGRR